MGEFFKRLKAKPGLTAEIVAASLFANILALASRIATATNETERDALIEGMEIDAGVSTPLQEITVTTSSGEAQDARSLAAQAAPRKQPRAGGGSPGSPSAVEILRH